MSTPLNFKDYQEICFMVRRIKLLMKLVKSSQETDEAKRKNIIERIGQLELF